MGRGFADYGDPVGCEGGFLNRKGSHWKVMSRMLRMVGKGSSGEAGRPS